MGAGRPRTWSPEDLERIGRELVEWSKGNDAFHISEFEIEKDLPINFCKKTAQRRPDEFGDLYKKAKHILGVKLLKQGITDKLDKWYSATLIPKYLDDVKEHILDMKREEITMVEKAKKMAEMEANAKLVSLMNDVHDHIQEKHAELQPETD
jgi:hypothetical protein